MNQIILASHGGLAAGAKDTLEMVLGDVSNVHVVSLARDDKEPITNKVDAMIATFNADDTVYVLTDMLGSSVNNNMVELVLANNDGMAEGAISALQTAGWNVEGGDKTIPVYGVDAMDSAVQKIDAGIMTGTVKQDGEAMAATIATLVKNVKDGADLMANTESYKFAVDEEGETIPSKIQVPYAMYTK